MHHPGGLGVECGLNEALAINPKSGVQEIYTPGLKVVVDALHTLELDGGMECVQVFNKLYKFLFSSSPQEEDVVDVTAPPVWSVEPLSLHPANILSSNQPMNIQENLEATLVPKATPKIYRNNTLSNTNKL